ncbi:MAG: M23 family metallopeptidase, partial [Bacillota bacterium]
VRAGQRVKMGQVIALVGDTGRSTGDHLHFELHFAGHEVDPWPYLVRLGG